jgi:hypothetical protein
MIIASSRLLCGDNHGVIVTYRRGLTDGSFPSENGLKIAARSTAKNPYLIIRRPVVFRVYRSILYPKT